MRYLVLAYGSEAEWNRLGKAEQDELLAQDAVLRARGDLVAAVSQEVTTVRAWDGTPRLEEAPLPALPYPLAGFGIIEADDLDEAVRLVRDTPCARAGGAVEIRPITAMG